MIFDAHCDIWTHVARKRLEGERDIMRNYHLNKFKESDINGGIFVVWVDPPYDKNPKYRTTQILSKIKEEIKDLRNEKKHNQQELDELKNLYKISDEIEEI